MLKGNKLKTAISVIILLLPILFGIIMWNKLPDVMTTHWGVDGRAHGFSGKAFAVFGLPAVLLVFHFVCLMFTLKDKKQKEQNPKALGIIFWIIPFISVFTNGIMYYAAFGKEFNLENVTPGLIGVMFIFIGNYLPKVKQNRTLGIKLPWTLKNEENWNKTHRLGGKLWVIGGIIMLFSVFLPAMAMATAMCCVIAAMVIIPVIYSYCIYKKHQRTGVVYYATYKSKAERIKVRISAAVGTVIIIVAMVLMFSGNIEVICEDMSLTINADYWTDAEIAYSEIDTVEYRENIDVGVRVNGFGSPRLSMGVFSNEEFGNYNLYAYTDAEEFVILTSKGKTLVIGMKEAGATGEIYNTILLKKGELCR